MLLLIDNYDSFTYNLVHYLGELGADVRVVRNDAMSVQDALALRPELIVLSPGPCDPAQAGICIPLTHAAAEARIPLLGVCLGRLDGFQLGIVAGIKLKLAHEFARRQVAGRDFFGFAQGKEDGRYVGFTFGKRTSLFLDSSLLLIEPVTAAGYAEAQRAAEEAARPKPTEPTPNTTGSGATPPRVEDSGKPTSEGGTAPQPVKKQFYGSIELDAIQAKKQFADIVDEVIMQFTARPGVKVKIAIEIQAESATGFDDGLQRAVKENCNVLRFKNSEFEE